MRNIAVFAPVAVRGPQVDRNRELQLWSIPSPQLQTKSEFNDTIKYTTHWAWHLRELQSFICLIRASACASTRFTTTAWPTSLLF